MTPVIVERLTDVYRRELDLYNQVLDLVEREREALVRCESLSNIIDSFERKRSILSEIESLDRAVQEEKREYRAGRSTLDARETNRLASMIDAVRQVIQRIITLEETNEATILAYGADSPMTMAAEDAR